MATGAPDALWREGVDASALFSIERPAVMLHSPNEARAHTIMPRAQLRRADRCFFREDGPRLTRGSGCRSRMQPRPDMLRTLLKLWCLTPQAGLLRVPLSAARWPHAMTLTAVGFGGPGAGG
eukprot:854227-Prymnesium_polylepis.5